MTLEMFAQGLGTVSVMVAGAWALLKVFARQYERNLDERFETQERRRQEARAAYETRFDRLETADRQHERSILELRAELPERYVRREDWVRSQSVIEAKIDALALRLENAILKRDV
ncbi:MAG: hypothetical protein IT529_06155 [Burkholderiales bacterium]|nr:hypothetical protein [Burkholderiales bacterium]